MTSADNVGEWYKAVQLYDLGRVDEALEAFKGVKMNAKMLLNIGCCHLQKNDLKTASETLTQAVTSDPHLALGFFFLGLTNYFQSKYEESIRNFQKSQQLLRGNKFVDYKQLGFNFKLFECEIMTNEALAHFRCGNNEKTKELLAKACELKSERKHEQILSAMYAASKNKPFQIFYPPKSELFRPSKASVANIKKKDYLGESKVISTDSEEDCYACFSGIKDKVIEQKKEEKRRISVAGPPPQPSFDVTDGLSKTPQRRSSVPAKSLEVKAAPIRRISTTKPPPMAPLPDLDQPDLSASAPASLLREAKKLTEDNGFTVRSEDIKRKNSKPFKALPKLNLIVQEDTQEAIKEETASIIVKTPTNENKIEDDNDDTVEVFLKFNVGTTVTLPRGFTLSQLEWAASNQQMPMSFEFRTEDSFGRQHTLTEENVGQFKGGKVLCFSSDS